jgi:DNA-binding Xre family transcriptional regulator
MKEKQITQYRLINEYHISAGQLSRLRADKHVSTHTLEMLCDILDCNIEDIITFKKDSSV